MGASLQELSRPPPALCRGHPPKGSLRLSAALHNPHFTNALRISADAPTMPRVWSKARTPEKEVWNLTGV